MQVPTPLPGADGLQFSPLLLTCRPVDVQARRALTSPEVAGPVERDRRLATGEIDAVRAAFSDVEDEGAGAPALIRLRARPEPARTEHLATAQFRRPSPHPPGHR